MINSELQITAFGRSDTGRRRNNNEDSFVCDAAHGIFLVADGMGGEVHGETASRITAEQFVETVMPFQVDTETTVPFEHSADRAYFTDIVRHAAEAANRAVFAYGKKNDTHRGMGSTLTAAVVHEEKLYVAHVGDSRLYKITDAGIEQITEDHTHVQEMVTAGMLSSEAARTHPKRHVITRCVGRRKSIKIDTDGIDLEAEAVYLLCSDGLNDMITDSKIHEIVTGADGVESAADRLIAEANLLGGRDNISVVLFRLEILIQG